MGETGWLRTPGWRQGVRAPQHPLSQMSSSRVNMSSFQTMVAHEPGKRHDLLLNLTMEAISLPKRRLCPYHHSVRIEMQDTVYSGMRSRGKCPSHKENPGLQHLRKQGLLTALVFIGVSLRCCSALFRPSWRCACVAGTRCLAVAERVQMIDPRTP